jgi:arylsulfatase A-like enzyme
MQSRTRMKLFPLLSLALVLASCNAPEHGAAARPPDLMLVVLDTVRSDHLSVYGYERKTSPELARLVQRGRLFERAWSTSSWTAPAHASLFTGLLPAAHHTTQESWTLPSELYTLAEILRDSGYDTVGIVGNPVLSHERQFDQGFATWIETWHTAEGDDRTEDERAAQAVKHLLATRDARRPLFLFVNLIGAHSPYDSCGDLCGAFGADPEAKPRSNQWLAWYLKLVHFGPEQLEHLRALYDAEILQVDHILGEITSALDGAGLIRSGLLVVTSDHGENIGDHGHMDHLFSLYESTVRVPLVLVGPRFVSAGTRDAFPAQLQDVFPTLLGVSGAEPARWSSNQAIDLRDGQARMKRPLLLEYYKPVQALSLALRFTPENLRHEFDRFRRRLRAVVADDWKLIVDSDGHEELYDLARDPDELVDRAQDAAESERRAQLLSLVEELRKASERPLQRPVENKPLADETRKALEALGYVE